MHDSGLHARRWLYNLLSRPFLTGAFEPNIFPYEVLDRLFSARKAHSLEMLTLSLSLSLSTIQKSPLLVRRICGRR